MSKNLFTVLIQILLLLIPLHIDAQEKKKPAPQAMPPAPVVVSEVRSGLLAPVSEFIGTVYYHQVSDVAAEVEGLVESVLFEEGKRVEKDRIMVKLSTDVLSKSLQAVVASYEQALSDLENARADFVRTETLYRENLVTESRYDDTRFRVQGLEKRAAALKAEVERQETLLNKKDVRAPFDGIVIRKHVERGEWLSPGAVVATVGSDNVIDVIAEVPEHSLKYLRQGTEVGISAGGKQLAGSIFAFIPKGDISTRTFPVRIRAKNTGSLIEGMEARVLLPVGERDESLMVPRDAVVTAFGNTVVYIIIDSAAKMVPVKVISYQGMTAGVRADGLHEGMKVVIKGNERLRDGQTVAIQQDK